MPEWVNTLTEYMRNNCGTTLLINTDDGGEFSAELDDAGGNVLYSVGGREDLLAALSKVAEWIDEHADD